MSSTLQQQRTAEGRSRRHRLYMSFYEIIESYDLRRYFYSHYARLVLPKATYKNCSSKLLQLKSLFVCLFVCLFVTEATQYCVHGGLEEIRGSFANPLSMIKVTTSYEYEASLPQLQSLLLFPGLVNNCLILFS